MAHFAELDKDNKVINLIVVDNNELLDDNGVESENKGIDFCVNLFGGKWVQTSYNATIRKHYAGIGFTYDAALDAFIPPKCHDEAQLDTTNYLWKCDNDGHKL